MAELKRVGGEGFKEHFPSNFTFPEGDFDFGEFLRSLDFDPMKQEKFKTKKASMTFHING